MYLTFKAPCTQMALKVRPSLHFCVRPGRIGAVSSPAASQSQWQTVAAQG